LLIRHSKYRAILSKIGDFAQGKTHACAKNVHTKILNIAKH